MIDKEHIKDPAFMSEAKALEEKKEKEEKLLKQKTEYYKRNEALMRELGVIELPILKSDPIEGIRPAAVVVLHDWKEGETYIPGAKKPAESKPEAVKKNGKKGK
jgi:hypothetical protein